MTFIPENKLEELLIKSANTNKFSKEYQEPSNCAIPGAMEEG